jgi:hypothetical protein
LVSKVFGTPFVGNSSVCRQTNPLSVEMENNVTEISEARKYNMECDLNTYRV